MRALGAVADAPGRVYLAGGHGRARRLAASDFIPEILGWEDRSRFITQEGRLSFCHYDDYGSFRAAVERAVR